MHEMSTRRLLTGTQVQNGIIDCARYQASMTEADMERTVSDLVAVRGGRLFHVRRSDVAPELTDLLDWLIIDPAGQRVLLVEAKSRKRAVTEGQSRVLELTRECSRFESFLVRSVNPKEGETAFDDFLNYLAGVRDADGICLFADV